jgi:hypothetical protein
MYKFMGREMTSGDEAIATSFILADIRPVSWTIMGPHVSLEKASIIELLKTSAK